MSPDCSVEATNAGELLKDGHERCGECGETEAKAQIKQARRHDPLPLEKYCRHLPEEHS